MLIGKGKLISAGTTAEFIAESSRRFVRVRSPQSERLEGVLRAKGAVVRREADGALAVSELCAPEIGDLAGTNGIFLHELATQSASLEEAFMELTRESVEFHGETLPVSNAQQTAGVADPTTPAAVPAIGPSPAEVS